MITVELTRLQRQLLIALRQEPGVGAGRLRLIVGARTRSGVTRSLRGMLERGLVRVVFADYAIEQYFLTDDGRASAQVQAA
jgi:DNA-binding MarR family transcriptional regulator